MAMFDILHKVFHVSYTLHIASDTNKGVPVVFLHGIASDSATWKNVIPLLPDNMRAIAIDLLGFGMSPKPKHNAYATEDHVAAIAKTIKSLQLREPAIIVGHSMGGLLAIEIAKKYPNMVSRLILISTPLYNQDDIIQATSKYAPNKKYFSNGLFIMYDKIMSSEKPTLKTALAVMKLAPSGNSFRLTKATWLPFKKSLANTIMRQTSLHDVRQLAIPVTLYYGKLDLLMQSKNYLELSQANIATLTIIKLNSAHMLTKNSAQIIAQDIISKNYTNSKIPT